MSESENRWLRGERINPDPIGPGWSVDKLVDETFLAYNAGRLKTAARLLVDKMLAPDCWVGASLSGAMTPAGLGRSVLIPMIRAGFIDWITTTGANLYHDMHFGLGLALHRGSHEVDDRLLRESQVVRIYDILFEFQVLLDTDAFIREVLAVPEIRGSRSTAEVHNHLGKYLAAREDELGVEDTCVLSTAYRCGVPCYVPSPGDSGIGMNVAELWMEQTGPHFDVSKDVNETTAIVYEAKTTERRSGVLIFGGGAPKNFILQTEPQIQEVLGLADKGHDYFVQITDARPDTGGLSGATPSEAVSWGKIDPERLPDSVVVYSDTTIAAPLLAAYAIGRHEPRPPQRLYDRREAMLEKLRRDYLARRKG